jgi:hypothetical protein
VFEEGQTKIYENKDALPRVFFVEQIVRADEKETAIEKLFAADFSKAAIVEGVDSQNFSKGEAEIVEYQDNKVIVKTQAKEEGFLVFTDSFYPTWEAMVDGKKTTLVRTDYMFRGVIVPKGNHTVSFLNNLL